MATYNSYEEAKIANPESEIYPHGDRFTIFNNGALITGTKCNPSDHCMTVEKFLADGHKFVKGDIYLNSNGRTLGVVNIPEYNNNRSTIDCKLYILRAAALENQMNIDKVETQTEHQEEMGALSGEGEWNGEGLPPVGVECEYKDGDNWYEVKVKYLSEWFMVIEALKSQSKWIDIKGTELSFEYSRFDSLEFRKPETQQQREDRERLEAAYDLYLISCHAANHPATYEFHEFKSEPDAKNGWLAVVEKTNYRMGVK